MRNKSNIMLATAGLVFIFCLALGNLINLENSLKEEPLISFKMVLFSDSDAEKLIDWCENQEIIAHLAAPKFGPRRIICRATAASFIRLFGIEPTDNLVLYRRKLPPSLKSVKWLAVIESDGHNG